jgi:hypothetical protein
MAHIPGMCIIVLTEEGISSDSPTRWLKSPTCARWIPTGGSSTLDSHQVSQRRSWQAYELCATLAAHTARHRHMTPR